MLRSCSCPCRSAVSLQQDQCDPLLCNFLSLYKWKLLGLERASLGGKALRMCCLAYFGPEATLFGKEVRSRVTKQGVRFVLCYTFPLLLSPSLASARRKLEGEAGQETQHREGQPVPERGGGGQIENHQQQVIYSLPVSAEWKFEGSNFLRVAVGIKGDRQRCFWKRRHKHM